MMKINKIVTFDPPVCKDPEQRQGLDERLAYYRFLCFISKQDKAFWNKVIETYQGNGTLGITDVCVYYDFFEHRHKPLPDNYGLYFTGRFDVGDFFDHYVDCLRNRPARVTL